MAATVQTLLVNVLILGVNVGTGIITARLLGPGGRGEQAAMVMWPQVLAFTATLGLPSALLYNLKRYPELASRLFSAALLLGTIMGGVAAVVGALFVPYWLTEYSPEVVRFAQWAMLAAPLILFVDAFGFILRAREEFALYNAFRYSQPLLTLIILGVLALSDRLTPFNAVLAYLLPAAPAFLWMLVRLWRLYHPVWQDLSPAFKRLTSYGSRSYGIDLLTTLSTQLDRILVVGLLSPAAMGLYVVALNLAQMLNVFQAAVVSVLFPKASGRTVEEVVSLAGLAARGSTTVTVLAAAGLALVSPWALGLLYGQEYLDAIPVFRLLLLVIVLEGTTLVLAQTFMAVGKPGVVTLLQGTGFALSLPLLLVLVPQYGLIGAGTALLISTAIRLVFVVASFPIVLKVRPPRLWPTRADLAAILYRDKGNLEG
jgi:O-antigen/teichoic acid export membrane protein